MRRKDFLVHDEAEICREGDIVRIEICRPISKSKSFAVAEIRSNKGQTFDQYNKLVSLSVAEEEHKKATEFIDQRKLNEQQEKEGTSVVQELRTLERYFVDGQVDESLAKKIEELQIKYGITSWPPTKPIAELEHHNLQQRLKDLTFKIKFQSNPGTSDLLNKLLDDPSKAKAIENALRLVSKKDPNELKRGIKKNLLRKYILKYEDGRELLA